MMERLYDLHAHIVLPAKSFFVLSKMGPLEDGEQDRAAIWAYMLHKHFELDQQEQVTLPAPQTA